MGATANIITGLLGLGSAGTTTIVTAAIAGAIGDDVMKRLVETGREGFQKLADPAAQPDNHHFLRVVRLARLNALRRLALETRDELNISRDRSPFLRELERWIDAELKRDPSILLDPRSMDPAELVRPPADGAAQRSARHIAGAAQALRGLFETPADCEGLFSASDKLAHEGIVAFFYSDLRMESRIASGDTAAVMARDEQTALRGGLEISVFGEMVLAVEAEDINWGVEAPKVFYRRFHDPARGFFASMRNEIQASLVEDAAFFRRHTALIGAETQAEVRALSAKIDALTAELQNGDGALKRQVEGVITEVLRAGLPADAFEKAVYGGRQDLIDLGNQLARSSNQRDPSLDVLRQEAAEHIREGRLSEAKSALLEMRARQREIRKEATLGEAEIEAELGQLASTRARYLEAADHFAAASDLVEPQDKRLWAQYRSREAGAACEQGLLYPGLAAFERAVTAYEAALRVYTEADMPGNWATTQNNRGNALRSLGARLGGAAGAEKLADAVTAYEAALRVYTEADMPAQWAMTQNNLGNALQNLGARLGGAAGAEKLADAVTAYEAALRVYTEADMPADWAMTQNNLGAALGNLGTRLGGAAGAEKLADAVTAYEAALRVYTEADVPADWAMTQNNLGAALQNLGARLGGAAGAEKLADAVTAYEAALRVRTEADMPADWATTQNNLGAALQNLGARLGGAAGAEKLAAAVTAYEAALRVYTEADMPAQWAMTQNNLGTALGNLGTRLGGAAGAQKLAAAVTAYEAALLVYTEADMPANWATTQNNLGAELQNLGRRLGGAAGAEKLAEAVTAYEAALRVYTEADMPAGWAMTQENLGLVFEDVADLSDDPGRELEKAIAAFEAALRVYTPEHMPYGHGTATTALNRVREKRAALDGE